MGRDGAAPGGAVPEEQVRGAANFARRGLTQGDTSRMGAEPGTILEGMGKVRNLDLREVSPTATPLSLQNALRPDEPAPCLTQEEALRNAPKKADGFFVVPRLDG